MTPRRLLVLLIAAVLVIAGAIWISMRRDLPRNDTLHARVLPGLSEHINDVNEVRVVTAGDVIAVTIRKVDDKRWAVVERDDYTADRKKLGQLLLALGNLSVLEQKTSNPANYPRLGVEDVKNDKATGVRVDVLGLKRPASLIVGNPAGARSTYVRPAQTGISVLARPQLSVERNPANWLERRILDVPVGRVQEVRVSAVKSAPYEVVREKRDQADFSVTNVPKGRELSSPSAAGTIAGALANLTLDDVRETSSGEPVDGEKSTAQFRLFDGTILTLAGTKSGNDHWLAVNVEFDDAQYERFAAAPAKAPSAASADADTGNAAGKPAAESTETPPAATTLEPAPTPARSAAEARKESETLAKRVAGWVYKIPAYKFETLFQPIEDLLAPQ